MSDAAEPLLSGRHRPKRISVAILLAMLTGAADATRHQAPIVRVPPVPSGPRPTPEERLARQATNMFALLARPDPAYSTFASLPKTTPVWVTVGGGDGGSRWRMATGDEARAGLLDLFRLPAGDRLILGTPEVTVNRDFGRTVMTFTTVRDKARLPTRCRVAYIDARRVHDSWEFIQLVLTPGGFGQSPACPGE